MSHAPISPRPPIGFSAKSPFRGMVASLLAGPLILCAICVIAASPAQAADDAVIPGAPHLLPQDTLAYIRLDSVDDIREDFSESSIGKMLADPKMKPFASDVYQTMNELFDQISAQLGVSLDELLSIPSGQVAAAAMPGILPEDSDSRAQDDEEEDDSPEAIRRRLTQKRRQSNAIAGMFMIDAGDNVDKLMILVERLEERLLESGYVRRTSNIKDTKLVHLLPPRSGPPEIEFFERDDTVVLGIGHNTAAHALDRWLDQSDEPTLADNADFAAVMSRCVGAEATRPQITFFVNPYPFVERMVKRGGAAALVWPMIEELGISKIRGIGGSAFRGGDEFDDITHFHMLIDPPRDGIFGVLRPESGESQPPEWVPGDVTSYTSMHWNFEATYDNVGKILENFQGPEPLKRLVEEPLKKEFGIELRDEILTNVTGRYVTCRWIQPPVKLNSQVQLHALEVSDSLAVKAAIAKIRERKPNALDVDTIGGNIVYLGRQGGRGGDQFPKGLRRPEPCFMLLGKWVIFSDSRTFIERVTRANTKALPQLINVPEYELISSELGGKLDGEKPFLVSFLRSADYIRQMYDLSQSDDSKRFLRTAGENNPVAKKIADLLQRNELPPFEDFEKYFAPSGTFAYDEPSGIHMGSFTLKGDASAP
jgi:hypothetical protein